MNIQHSQNYIKMEFTTSPSIYEVADAISSQYYRFTATPLYTNESFITQHPPKNQKHHDEIYFTAPNELSDMEIFKLATADNFKHLHNLTQGEKHPFSPTSIKEVYNLLKHNRSPYKLDKFYDTEADSEQFVLQPHQALASDMDLMNRILTYTRGTIEDQLEKQAGKIQTINYSLNKTFINSQPFSS